MNTSAQRALDRVKSSDSLTNIPAIIAGFQEKGIDADNIKPRQNVFTFKAWIALGRVVRKGEHGVKIMTFIPVYVKDDKTGEKVQRGQRPWTTTVFHVSQTKALG